MVFTTMTSAVASAAAGCVAVAALAACAAPNATAADAPPPLLRVMVKLVRGSADATAIGAEAGRVAGIPVSYAAATSTTWHSLTLHCSSAAQCDTAIARLRAAVTIYQSVEIDARKTPAS